MSAVPICRKDDHRYRHYDYHHLVTSWPEVTCKKCRSLRLYS
jgi:hypothetical protein